MIFDKCEWLFNPYNSINFNNLPHGIIINGPRGVGKKLLAKKISEKIISNFNENLNNDHQNLLDKTPCKIVIISEGEKSLLAFVLLYLHLYIFLEDLPRRFPRRP